MVFTWLAVVLELSAAAHAAVALGPTVIAVMALNISKKKSFKWGI